MITQPAHEKAVEYFSPTASILAKDTLWMCGATVCSHPPHLDTLEKVEAEVTVKRWQAKEDVMSQAIVVILHANNERQLFQNALAETAGNRLRIYRQADPRGLAGRQLVAEFALDEVQSWFAMADPPR